MSKKIQRKLEIIQEVEILDIASEGKSIAKVENLVVFIPFVVPGDIVDIEITKKKKNYAEARAIKFHKYSLKRVETKCPHFGVCGGCKWQMLDYKYQLESKNKQVLDNLQRIGHIDISSSKPIIGSENIFFYRNKLEYTFSTKRWLTSQEIEKLEEKTHNYGFGFHAPMFFDKVIDIEYCALQRNPSNSIRDFIKEYSIENNLSYYDIRYHHGLLRNAIIRTTENEDLMLIMVFAEKSNEIVPMLQAIEDRFPEITSLMYCVNTKFNDTLYDQDIRLYKGRDYIIEHMPKYNNQGEDFKFRIGPKSFYQTNSKQAYTLYSLATEMADLKPDQIVYDLYTGIGTIANFVSPYVKKVVGIESVEEAIEDAKTNSFENGIENTVFYAGDISKVLDDEFLKENGYPDIIITDPPRVGMGDKVANKLLEIKAKKIIYISCNSATQARDLEVLTTLYDVKTIQPVDMFPHTQHVENIVELELKQN